MTWELVRHVNGRPWTRCQVGWYVVSEPKEFSQYGEYAADYWSARVEPGDYPLYAFRDCGQPWHSLGVEMPATVVSGSWWNKMQPGSERSVYVSPRAYSVAAAIVNGEQTPIRLLEGVEARAVQFEYNGEQKTTHGLFCGHDQF